MNDKVPQQRTSNDIDKSGGGEATTQRRARMLVEITALVVKGLPCPEAIYLYLHNRSADLVFGAVADALAWIRHVGVSDTWVRDYIYTPEGKDTPIRLVSGHLADWCGGWSLALRGSEPVGDVAEALDPSDPAVATVLAAAGQPIDTAPGDVLDEVDAADCDEPAEGGGSDG